MKNLDETFINRARYRSKLLIVLIACNIALSSFYFGYHNNCFGTLKIETMIEIYSIPLIPSTASGVINGIIPLSSIFGAVLTYHFVSRLSRRVTIRTCRKFYCILIVLLSWLDSLSSSRNISSYCLGGFCKDYAWAAIFQCRL